MLADPRALSRLSASFIATGSQGILRSPFSSFSPRCRSIPRGLPAPRAPAALVNSFALDFVKLQSRNKCTSVVCFDHCFLGLFLFSLFASLSVLSMNFRPAPFRLRGAVCQPD